VREEVRAELKRKRKIEEESEDDENDITLLGKYGTGSLLLPYRG
jgi:hypothetical protein